VTSPLLLTVPLDQLFKQDAVISHLKSFVAIALHCLVGQSAHQSAPSWCVCSGRDVVLACGGCVEKKSARPYRITYKATGGVPAWEAATAAVRAHRWLCRKSADQRPLKRVKVRVCWWACLAMTVVITREWGCFWLVCTSSSIPVWRPHRP